MSNDNPSLLPCTPIHQEHSPATHLLPTSSSQRTSRTTKYSTNFHPNAIDEPAPDSHEATPSQQSYTPKRTAPYRLVQES